MSKNPLQNALLAALYIVGIVLLIHSFAAPDTEDNILIPMVMISLFVFSAAVMGFLFLGRPLELYFENKRQEAVQFFLKTLGSFAVFVIILVGALFFISF